MHRPPLRDGSASSASAVSIYDMVDVELDSERDGLLQKMTVAKHRIKDENSAPICSCYIHQINICILTVTVLLFSMLGIFLMYDVGTTGLKPEMFFESAALKADLEAVLPVGRSNTLILGFGFSHAEAVQSWLAASANYSATALSNDNVEYVENYSVDTTSSWELVPVEHLERGPQLTPPPVRRIMVLRDPVKRFLSSVAAADNLKMSQLFPSNKLEVASLCGLQDVSTTEYIRNICTGGLYINKIKEYTDTHGYNYGQNFLVVLSSELFLDPQYNLIKLAQFLGFSPQAVFTWPTAHSTQLPGLPKLPEVESELLKKIWSARRENAVQQYYGVANEELCGYLSAQNETCPFWTTYVPRNVHEKEVVIVHPPVASPEIMDTIPQNLILGFQKSGTSTLRAWLGEHPEIQMYRQETAFFDKICRKNVEDCTYEIWAEELEALRLAVEQDYIGRRNGIVMAKRGSVYDNRGRDVFSLLPNAKIIMSMRDPVARFKSRYNMRVKTAVGNAEELAYLFVWWTEMVPNDKDSPVCGGIDKHEDNCDVGKYVHHLKHLTEYFPLGSTLMLITLEEHLMNPNWDSSVVAKFLGLKSLSMPEIPHAFSLATGDHGPTMDFTELQKERLQQFYQPYNLELCSFLKARDHRCAGWTYYPEPQLSKH